jgi:hypothetical protein
MTGDASVAVMVWKHVDGWCAFTTKYSYIRATAFKRETKSRVLTRLCVNLIRWNSFQ